MICLKGKSLLLLVLHLYFIKTSCADKQSYLWKHDSENIILLENMLLEMEAKSSLQCAIRCKSTPFCKTLTVTSPPSATMVTCRGHSSHVTNSTVTSAAWTTVWTVESAWLERACLSNAECPAPRSECFAGSMSCLCSPGYYYSHSEDSCIDTCAEQDLQEQFLVYPGVKINSNNIAQGCTRGNITISDCLQLCGQNPQVRTCDYRQSPSIACCPQLVTKLDVPEDWRDQVPVTHCQKTCL